MKFPNFLKFHGFFDSWDLKFKKIVTTSLPYLPVLLIAILWFVKDFPARMSSDSITSWDQVINGNYRNDHLVIYTLYLKIASLNGSLLWLVPMFQIFLTLFAFDKILRLFKFSSIRRSVVLFLCFLTPVVGGFMVTIWKDVPFTIFLILGSTYFSQYLKNDSKRDGLLGFTFLTCGISFRHNGWVLTIFLIIFIFVFSWKLISRKHGVKVAGLLILSIISSQLISDLAVEITDAKREPSYLYSLSFAADLAYIASAHPNKADQEVFDIVSRFATGESFKGASNCTGVGYLIIPAGFNQDGLADNAKEIFSVWVKNLFTNFDLILEARKCRALPFIPPPFIRHPIHPTWLFPGVYEPNAFGLHTIVQEGFVFKALQTWENLWQKYALIVAWPAALGSVGLLFALFIKRRNPDVLMLIRVLSALIVASLVSLWFVSLSPDYRYAAISQFLGVFFAISGMTYLAKFFLRDIHKFRLFTKHSL